MLSIVAFPIVGISAKQHEVEGDWANTWLQTHEMGTGPFKLKDFKPKEYIVWEKFDDYWKGWEGTKNNLRNIVVKTVLESTTRKLMLLSGELDLTSHVLLEDIPELMRVQDVELSLFSFAATTYLLLRARPETPLEDARMRQALAYAIDYDAFIEGVYRGYAVKAESLMAHTFFGFKSTFQIKQNITKAKELLAQAGYEQGQLTLKYIYNIGVPYKESLGELLKDNFAQIGINLELVPVTWPTLVQSLFDPDAPYDLYSVYTPPNVPDALGFIRQHYHSDSIGPERYSKWHPDSYIDGLIEKAEGAVTKEEYVEYLGDIQQFVSDNVLTIHLTDAVECTAMRDYVKGFIPPQYHNYEYYWYGLYIEK